MIETTFPKLRPGRLTTNDCQDIKSKVFEAMAGDDAETNDKGEIALHGRTIAAWTTAIPGAPLRSGG